MTSSDKTPTAFEKWELPFVNDDNRAEVSSKPPSAHEIEQFYQAAQKEGYEQGLAEGRQQGVKQFNDGLEKLNTLIKSLRQSHISLDSVLLEQLASMVFSLAEKIAQVEIEKNPEQIKTVIKQAVAMLPTNLAPLKVYLNTEDYATVSELQRIGDTEISAIEGAKLQSSTELKKGGCVIESGNTTIDASYEARLEEMMSSYFSGKSNEDA